MNLKTLGMIKFLPFTLFLSTIYLHAQAPIKIGIWERFDAKVLQNEHLYINHKEVWDAKDNDKNGYIDDIHGINFNENEELAPYLMVQNSNDDYEHGTAIASKIQEKCKVPFIVYGVGFEYTTDRIEKSGLGALSVKERLNQLPKEYKKMEFFVQQSIKYFSENKIQVVNMSWGLNAEHVAEINPNFGENPEQRKAIAKDWISHFKNYLEKYIKENPQIIFVVSVGNDGQDIDEIMDVPATIIANNLIVVGGLNTAETEPAAFSNIGKNIDYWAPSESVSYTTANGKTEKVDGVSIAAPVATAKIAELIFRGEKISKTTLKKID